MSISVEQTTEMFLSDNGIESSPFILLVIYVVSFFDLLIKSNFDVENDSITLKGSV